MTVAGAIAAAVDVVEGLVGQGWAATDDGAAAVSNIIAEIQHRHETEAADQAG